MIAVDTNVLVRLFADDDQVQTDRVDALVEAQAAMNGVIWIADVVLAELIWVLIRSYQRSRIDILAVLEALLQNSTISLESANDVEAAMALYARSPADFVDCFLAIKARTTGCEVVRSFDRKMKGLPGVAVL